MITGFYTGAQGARSFQQNMDVISNNIANVNTYGYKPQRLSFSDLIRTGVRPNLVGIDPSLEVGHGQRGIETAIDMAMSAVEVTDHTYDVCIQGNGFFAVAAPGGDIYYTRDGNFHVSVEADGEYLVNSMGWYVLGPDEQPVLLPADTQDFILAGPDASGDNVVYLGVFEFANPYALSLAGQNLYSPSETSGAITPSSAPVIQGALERSGVNLAKEIVSMIRTQRAYQLSLRTVSIADEIEQMTNGMRT